jgi:hypothetical protein
MQELAVAQNGWRTSKLSVWVRHKKYETFWVRPSPHLYPLTSGPSGPGSQLRKSALSSRCLTLQQQQPSLYSQASWGKLEMKPHEQKKNKSEKKGKTKGDKKPNKKGEKTIKY